MEYILLLVIAELFEAYIQRANTLFGVLEKLYVYYKKNVFLFFAVQPSFYIILYVILATGILNASMIFLLALKIFDIFYKIELIKTIFIKHDAPLEVSQLLERNMPSWFFFMGVSLYPPLLYFSLS